MSKPAPAAKRRIDRDALLPPMAQFLLENGVHAASLRPLAKAAGTSDRMLVYHFGSKDALVEEVLMWLADRVQAQLGQLVPAQKEGTLADFATMLFDLLRQPMLRPHLALLMEVSACCARGQDNFLIVCQQVVDSYHTWLVDIMPPTEGDRTAAVAHMLATVEGALMQDMAGREAFARMALERAFGD
ncbi:MAG: TetR/AcrR family transcriptional regulator [Pseudomonadota bacterium]